MRYYYERPLSLEQAQSLCALGSAIAVHVGWNTFYCDQHGLLQWWREYSKDCMFFEVVPDNLLTD